MLMCTIARTVQRDLPPALLPQELETTGTLRTLKPGTWSHFIAGPIGCGQWPSNSITTCLVSFLVQNALWQANTLAIQYRRRISHPKTGIEP